MNEQAEEAFRRMDEALRTISRQGSSNPLAQRNGAENRYGQAYNTLVKLGIRPQLRMKYRAGR